VLFQLLLWALANVCFCCVCVLQDLSEYKRFRDKHVATAARGLISAFRELNPGAWFVCWGEQRTVQLQF
jgi:hypothetical protein